MLYDYNEDEFVDLADILYTVPLDKILKLGFLAIVDELTNEDDSDNDE